MSTPRVKLHIGEIGVDSRVRVGADRLGDAVRERLCGLPPERRPGRDLLLDDLQVTAYPHMGADELAEAIVEAVLAASTGEAP